MAEDQNQQLHSTTKIRGAPALRKEIAQAIKQLKAISAKASAAAKFGEGAHGGEDEFDIDAMRDDLMACGNRLVKVARKITQSSSGQGEGEVIHHVGVENFDNDGQGEELRQQAEQAQAAAGRRYKMVALANNVKVTKKHRHDGVTQCYGCMKQCVLKEKVSQCLNCQQLIHKKCLEQREITCPNCLQSFCTKV